MNYFELYLFTRLDAIGFIACLFAVVACVGLIAAVAVRITMFEDECRYQKAMQKKDASDIDYWNEEHQQYTKAKFFSRVLIPVAALSLLLAVAIPSKEDAALIYGMHWASNNADLQAIPDEAASIVRQWLNKAAPVQDSVKVNK